jgi:hypothetical protein
MLHIFSILVIRVKKRIFVLIRKLKLINFVFFCFIHDGIFVQPNFSLEFPLIFKILTFCGLNFKTFVWLKFHDVFAKNIFDKITVKVQQKEYINVLKYQLLLYLNTFVNYKQNCNQKYTQYLY